MSGGTEATIIKILLLGQSNVGKTSLITRYSQDKFDAQSNLLTVGIDIRNLNRVFEGKPVVLECMYEVRQCGTRRVRKNTRRSPRSISEGCRVYYWCTT